MKKVCVDCVKELPITKYHFRPDKRARNAEGGYYQNYCKNCHRSRCKRNKLKYSYGLSVEGYHKLLCEQQGKCAICGTTNPNAAKKRTFRFSVDHNHETNEIRGLLCNSCNAGLGMFGDNPLTLIKASEYLLKKGHYSGIGEQGVTIDGSEDAVEGEVIE